MKRWRELLGEVERRRAVIDYLMGMPPEALPGAMWYLARTGKRVTAGYLDLLVDGFIAWLKEKAKEVV